MASAFHFPDVGEGIHEGRVVAWLVREGDPVALDQPLVKVETDKAVVEIPSPVAGVVGRLAVPAGGTVHVGDVLVQFDEAGGAPAGAAPAGLEAARAPAAAPAATPVPQVPGLRPPATPHTRALARQLGVDLASVTASGPRGRITDEDVRQAAVGSAPPSAGTAPFPSPPRTEEEAEERVPLTHLRKVIADAMSLSVQTAAHVTHVDEADVTELVAMQARIKAARTSGPRITLLPLFLKATAAALRDHPWLNATFDAEKGEVVLKRHVHLGIAVDTPEGLIVPVVRHVDRKDVRTLAVELDDLATRARERRLDLAELRGATSTVTNIGPIGGVFATPILHQPELSIVGFHAIKDRPAVVDGQVVPRKLMYVSVSFDHRFIDGAEAARFAADLVGLLTDLARLMTRL